MFGGLPYNYISDSTQKPLIVLIEEEDYQYYDWYVFTTPGEVKYNVYSCFAEIGEVENPINPNNPDSYVYWKNIIPQDYSIFNRQGIVKSEDGTFKMPQRNIEYEGPNNTQNQQEWVYDENSQGGVNVDYCDGDPNGNCKWENFLICNIFQMTEMVL